MSNLLLNLCSGVVGALLAVLLGWIQSYYRDKKEKEWTLRAELRRHKVGRLVTANDGLRTCFFLATTELDYHLLALLDIELSFQNLSVLTDPNEGLTLLRQEAQRYNQQIGAVEARARAHVAFLDESLIGRHLIEAIRGKLALLIASITSNSTSVKARIDLFRQQEPEVMRLLNEVDACISAEISKQLL